MNQIADVGFCVFASLREAIAVSDLSDLWLLLQLPGIGPVRARQLVERCSSPSAVWEAAPEELLAVPSIGPRTVAALEQARRRRPLAARQVEEWQEQGLWLLSLWDEGYPRLLRQVSDAPPLLYGWGRLQVEDEHAVAIVGSRQASEEGMEWARRTAAELARRGLTVVSGLALGIDGAAHWGAVEVGGRTLGVLGCGHARLFPVEHRDLALLVMRQGAVLSELEPNAPVHVSHLMARDRIISGLARATIVVEAGLKSGSMDTAEKTLRQQRRLYAVEWDHAHTGREGLDDLLRRGKAQPLSGSEEPVWETLVAEILSPLPFEREEQPRLL